MEIEIFVELASTNYMLIEIVIKDMLMKTSKGNGENLSLLKIMCDNVFNNDSHWTLPIFDEYKNLLKDTKDRHTFFKNK